jgi:hypothetical protein
MNSRTILHTAQAAMPQHEEISEKTKLDALCLGQLESRIACFAPDLSYISLVHKTSSSKVLLS